jgi:serine/threonine-protein kinase
MGRLQHPNVVSVYDVGSADPAIDEELPYLVMELIRGSSLDQLLLEGPLAPERAAHIMEQACRALGAAHEAGVIHRDLKPSNIMVSEDDHVKVLDFGLARLNQKEGQAPEETLTTPGMVLGSCPYMAPEQALGQRVGPESDIFSCGSVLYEALTGQRAFDGPTPMRVLQAVVKCDYRPIPEIAPDVPAGLVEVVERCLQPEAEMRYRSCLELAPVLYELTRALTSSQVNMPAVTLDNPADSFWSSAAGRWVLTGISFAAGVAAGLAFGFAT